MVKLKGMKDFFNDKIIALAKSLNKPLYAVGGIVRNFLIDQIKSSDIDLCAPIRVEDFESILKTHGFIIITSVMRTGTIIFSDSERKYEFTSFRKEKYVGGEHTPFETEFIEDILDDALRRDFKCNAVYYDIAGDKIVDPLGGLEDIKKKELKD